MNASGKYVQCLQCNLTRDEFEQSFTKSESSGLFSKHCNLCLGKDDSGDLLHGYCLICEDFKFSSMTIEAIYKHYARKHKQIINAGYTIRDIHRKFQPHDYPDLDLNQNYGLILSRQNVLHANEEIEHYWNTFTTTPALIYNDVRTIRDQHREAFHQFFGMDPISFHGHVSDAANPHVITSLLMHLNREFPRMGLPKTFGKTTRLAVMEGSYGMGFGPLAYNAPCDWSSDVASGSKPVTVRMNAAKIQQQIKTAKANGCVAFLVSIVHSTDGGVMTTDEWRATIEACKKHGMVLVVDEALTAVRCGAPFAHQLPEYQCHGRPDLVLFGKGIRTSGIAVDWHGVNLQALGDLSPEERVKAIVVWQGRFTDPAPPEILLQSWGTISLAQTQEWPKRAVEIGRVLRDILSSFGISLSSISGLHSLLWLSLHDRALSKMAVMSANAGNDYTRWLPLMDPVMTSKAEMETKVFGRNSRQHRKLLAAYLLTKGWCLGYCSDCGNAVETGDDRTEGREGCNECLVRPCDTCEPGIHVCPLLRAPEGDGV